MREKLISKRANRVIGKYKSYSDFSLRASKSEKKIVLESTILKANELQRNTVK
jgi:hypothetical protein